MILFLSSRNLILQRKRYFLILCAILACFAIITIVAGLSGGALSAVKSKAARYFAGNVSVTGYLHAWPRLSRPQAIIDHLLASSLQTKIVSPRTSYNLDASLFFNGETIRQRKLVGIDFAREGSEFAGLQFTQGGWESLAVDAGRDNILISVAAAKLLGCRVGDEVLLSVIADTGQYNTANLIVSGIFNETSLFGYIAYMRIIDLNRILAMAPDSATDIAVYAQKGVDLERFAEEVRLALAESYKVFPRFASREERDMELAKGSNNEETLAVLSQNAQLAQIKQLVDALFIVAYFTMAIFIVIVMVGILNTYRVLVHERTREIGVMRALGMSRRDVRFVFLAEAGLLSLFSSLIGLALGALSLHVLRIFNFSAVPAAGIFLEAGQLRILLDPSIIVVNILVMVSAALVAAWGPANKASLISPVEAMRSI
jgi:putative ABC transport system permease protein